MQVRLLFLHSQMLSSVHRRVWCLPPVNDAASEAELSQKAKEKRQLQQSRKETSRVGPGLGPLNSTAYIPACRDMQVRLLFLHSQMLSIVHRRVWCLPPVNDAASEAELSQKALRKNVSCSNQERRHPPIAQAVTGGTSLYQYSLKGSDLATESRGY